MNDDSFAEGVCHPGKACIPVALAVAEREGSTGKDLLTAIVAGIEIGCRASAALCQSPESHKARLGWRCTIADGLFGAVAGGKLLGLDPSQMASAMGMAANASSGLDQTFPITNEWAWDAGRASYLAVLVADFARGGMTSGTKLEGTKGHIQMFTAGRADPALAEPRLVRGLGHEWLTEYVIIKSRTASYLVHNVIEAAYRVVVDNDIATDAIAKITLRQSAWTADRDHGWELRDYDSALFDTPYEIAVGLLDRSPLTLPDDIVTHLDDPRAKELAGKLVSEAVPSIDGLRGIPAPATAILETTDGRVFETTAHEAMGSYPDTPFPEEFFLEKVRRNAGSRLDTARIEKLISAVNRLETLEEIGALTDVLVPAP
jgi:2-methylcitrate dehydratase PrpD